MVIGLVTEWTHQQFWKLFCGCPLSKISRILTAFCLVSASFVSQIKLIFLCWSWFFMYIVDSTGTVRMAYNIFFNIRFAMYSTLGMNQLKAKSFVWSNNIPCAQPLYKISLHVLKEDREQRSNGKNFPRRLPCKWMILTPLFAFQSWWEFWLMWRV